LPPVTRDTTGGAVGEQLAEALDAARSQIDHAAPGRVPRFGTWQLDVGVILERDEGSVYAEELDLIGGLNGWVL
jgi:hypothetical protein